MAEVAFPAPVRLMVPVPGSVRINLEKQCILTGKRSQGIRITLYACGRVRDPVKKDRKEAVVFLGGTGSKHHKENCRPDIFPSESHYLIQRFAGRIRPYTLTLLEPY